MKMIRNSKDNVISSAIASLVIIGSIIWISSISGCSAGKSIVSQKSGAQLWGENCIRCHNVPSPAAYNNVDWETIGKHMRVRANLTEEESAKIFEFLKSAN